MRIAMISAHSSPLAALGGKEAGGMNVYIRELSRELASRGLSIDIFTRTQKPNAPVVITADRGVRVINLRAGPPVPYNKNWLLQHLPEFVSRIRCFADGEDLIYDLIHSHYWLSGQAALPLRHAWGIPIVHMFHTLGAMKNRIARSSEEQETTKRMEVESHVAREVDMIVAATPQDRADLVWHCGADQQRIRVVPCGVDLDRFRPEEQATARTQLDLPPQPHRLILLVGRIEPLKGIDALIEAIALLREQHPEWQDQLMALVVGGANEYERKHWNAEQQRLHELRTRLGVADAVRFVGAQSQDQLAHFYTAADIVTMPSHYESFGMVALEGLASGRPVVATSAGGPAFIVEDGKSGLLTQPNNPVMLANHLERILTDQQLQTQMGNAARERAQRFGWTNVACDILRVYGETLDATTLRMAKEIRRRLKAC